MKYLNTLAAAAVALLCQGISAHLMAQTVPPRGISPVTGQYQGPDGYQVRGSTEYIRDNIQPDGRVIVRQATESDLWRSNAIGERREQNGGGSGDSGN